MKSGESNAYPPDLVDDFSSAAKEAVAKKRVTVRATNLNSNDALECISSSDDESGDDGLNMFSLLLSLIL